MTTRDSDQQVVSAWRDLLARHAALACDLDRALHEHGLGMSDFEVLDRLVDAGDCMRMHHLAEEVHLSQSALSRLVSRLERDGLLSRSMCEDDRRGIFVTLTDLGRQRHTAALPAQREVLTTHIGVASPAQIGAASPAHVGAASPAAGAASPALGATSPASTWETTDGQLALAEGTR